MKRLLLIMAFPIFIIAVAWSLTGAWLILPFAGLEFGLLAFLMYRVSLYTYQEQLIILSPNVIIIETGYRHKKILKIKRHECFVDFRESEDDWQLPGIFMHCGEQRVEVGIFLNLPDKKELRRHLEQAGLPVCRTHWWKQ
ncbi:DUF2244 domain-containing protein [Alteromonas pelagimontana]|uniref:DUF2244 domain-containing protein n=1 Tax=Alteromonas pelagimontana TaxID=1858656 RepID=A0A6M4MG79_9ALTE|nr:DUF2244 domain-containing protein [Alteromonas pelagimontana]QJR82194.1 DUF2244 domain-containing protein [Alteromonas pelagimontana]